MFRTTLLAAFLITPTALATDHYVNALSGPHLTIQSAIVAASPGDRVLIEDIGMVTDYVEDIDFLGKDIVVRSAPSNAFEVAIVGTGTGPVVTMRSGETTAAQLRSLYVKGGASTYGGGILIENSGATIMNVLVNHCTADFGGGIAIINSSALLAHVGVEQNNEAGSGFYGVAGGGIYTENSKVKMKGGWVDLNRAMEGGGMYSIGSTLEFHHTKFALNEADSGGGIYLDTSLGDANFVRCEFLENLVQPTAAAAPSVGSGAMLFESSAKFFFSKFDENRNLNGPGGGIAANYATLLLEDSEIARCSSEQGGGLALKRSKAAVVRSNIMLNEATRQGGGVYTDQSSCFLYAEQTRFNDNTAWTGGGICAGEGSSFLLTQTEIRGNAAEWGGGVFADGNSGTRTIHSSNVVQNDAANNGGGIYVQRLAPFAVIGQSYIQNNRAGFDGGGVWAFAADFLLQDSFCCFNNAAGIGGGLRSFWCAPVLDASVISNNLPTDVDGSYVDLASSIGGGC